MKNILIVFALSGLLLAACSSPSSNATPQAEFTLAGIVGGTEGTLTLNGQRLNLGQANISLDDEVASMAAVKPGVELSAKASSSSSGFDVSDVEVNTRVKGQITTVDLTASELEAVGVKVKVDALTRLLERGTDGNYTDITLADLQAGDYLEIYGVPDANDALIATRIELKLEDRVSKVEIRMPLRNLDEANQTFSYGLKSYVVDYSSAELRGNLVEGSIVRLRGTVSGNSITAERVRNKSSDDKEDSSSSKGQVELKGPVTNLDTTAKTFNLLDYFVDYSAAKLEGNLQAGSQVEVKGQMSGSTLLASKVETKHESRGSGSADGKQEGIIDALTETTITISGTSFWVDASTKVERNDRHIAFSDLQLGDWVELKFNSAKKNDAALAYATKIEIESASSNDSNNNGEVEIISIISNFDAAQQSFTLGNSVITVTNTTEYEDDAKDRDLSSSAFWSVDRTGQRVKVEGRLNGDSLVAREIKLR